MEAIRLATKLTSTLAPALPFLLTTQAGGQFTGDEIPESALAADKSIWQKILPRTKDRPSVYEAAIQLAKNSHDIGAQSEFSHELSELLESDAALFEDLKKEVIHHFVYHHFDGVPAPAAH
jgi:hypothetical protein